MFQFYIASGKHTKNINKNGHRSNGFTHEKWRFTRLCRAHCEELLEVVAWLPVENDELNGLVSGKIYRKPWFLPSNIGLSCKFSHHPIL